MSFTKAVHKKAIELGKLSVEMTTVAGSGHPSTALSLAHLVTVLMYHQMRWDPKDPWNPAADRLVLSEGHAVPIIYAAYADLGGGAAVGRGDGAEARSLRLHRPGHRRPRPRPDRQGLPRAAGGAERQSPAGDRGADGEGLGRAQRAGHGPPRHAGQERQDGAG